MAVDPVDHELLRRFEAGALGDAPFGHLDHVRVAWSYLVRDGFDAARRRFPVALLRFAVGKGHPEIFDPVLTDDWLVVIEAARRAHPSAATFEALVEASPHLRDKTTVPKRSRACDRDPARAT